MRLNFRKQFLKKRACGLYWKSRDREREHLPCLCQWSVQTHEPVALRDPAEAIIWEPGRKNPHHKLMWQCCTHMLSKQLKDGFGFHCSYEYTINILTSRKMYVAAFCICNQIHAWFIIFPFCKGGRYTCTAGYCVSPLISASHLIGEHSGSSWTLGHPAHYYRVQHLPSQSAVQCVLHRSVMQEREASNLKHKSVNWDKKITTISPLD